jgi:F-type H+-transporting ATPase subunit gamma
MATLEKTKKRQQAVETIKKSTKAMQLVATAKLARTKKYLKSVQEYYTSVFNTFQDLVLNVKDVSKIFPKDAKDNALYITINSDLGLCGSYNSNVYKLLKQRHKKNDRIIALGSKGISHFENRNYTLEEKYIGISDEPDYNLASSIAKDVIKLFFNKDIKEVNLIHTRFINSVTFEAVNIQLLPITKNAISNIETKITKSASSAITEFEPSPEVVLEKAIPLYISAIIFGSLIESKIAEMSSRRIAMENATDNAEDLIKQLQIEYNRARQSKITQEISEIVSGAEAL